MRSNVAKASYPKLVTKQLNTKVFHFLSSGKAYKLFIYYVSVYLNSEAA